MSSQVDEQQPSVSQQSTTSRNAEIVHHRVSELLDDATEHAAEPSPQLIAADPASLNHDGEDQEPVEERLEVDIGSILDDPSRLVRVDDDTVAPDASMDVVEDEASDADADESNDEVTDDADTAEKPRQQADVIVTRGSSASEETLSPNTVRIRGRQGGVLIEVDEGGDWPVVLSLLEERLATVEGFFTGGRTVLEVGNRDIYESELRNARGLLSRHHMTLAVVRSTSEVTIQSALLSGLSTSNETPKEKPPQKEVAPVISITQSTSPYFVHNGTLRSGQTLRKSESVVIVGDVNPGATVISSGDVMIWGRLRGIAFAGEGGNHEALVAAIEFTPTQLRIADLTAVAPEPQKPGFRLRFWKKEEERRPEVAHISEGRIVVEPWDDTRPGRPKFGHR